MGSTESTGRSNGTEEEEEERPAENSSSGGGSMGAGTAVAIAAAGTVLAAWGISRMTSSSSDSGSKGKDNMMNIKADGTESSFPNSFNRKGPSPYSIKYEADPRRFKMNVGAICKGKQQADGVERGPCGYAGILRNDRGIWVKGFLGYIAGYKAEILEAVIYAMNRGLELLSKDDKYRGSVLESDHHEAVNWVNGKYDCKSKPEVIKNCWYIIENIRQLAKENDIQIDPTTENANRCAYKLADIALREEKNSVLENLPQDSEFEKRYDQDLKSWNG